MVRDTSQTMRWKFDLEADAMGGQCERPPLFQGSPEMPYNRYGQSSSSSRDTPPLDRELAWFIIPFNIAFTVSIFDETKPEIEKPYGGRYWWGKYIRLRFS
ncbi:hypothetical protein [Erythrobacter sp.]|uniref:hypothetical protein n=1 Tax=Erythrobacter sp. TaxID=1042 RepID=UPI001B11A634|nr:hypothetical protein [Erythrobacter sp.]MBO6527575.1 hypothetical protein [Erythrobacter sp.]MBO6530255.1 hypothetical protein [Erythrobacter sp.]